MHAVTPLVVINCNKNIQWTLKKCEHYVVIRFIFLGLVKAMFFISEIV